MTEYFTYDIKVYNGENVKQSLRYLKTPEALATAKILEKEQAVYTVKKYNQHEVLRDEGNIEIISN